ncbi:MAG TPA: hypothetical protein VGQ69_16325 [Gemmatimonadales bacterium]|jgi:hypothetical protein|nr:hypothetical protein [Gemmatimonadales bacterium]
MQELESLRHDAIRILSGAVASDRLSVEQFEARLALVRQAPNRATLDAIVADVLPSGGYQVPTGLVPAVRDHTTVAPVEPAELLRIRTVLSSSKRAGSWTVPLRLSVKVALGELTIDLRDAVFCSDVLDMELDVLLGSFTLIVPAGAQVENECEERWSSTTHSTRSARGANPIGLLIRLTGRVRWSNVEIKEKRRSGEEPESAWQRLLEGSEQ